MKKLLCIILGHWVGELSVGLAQATCGRCKRTYHAHYDMSYGETIFDAMVENRKLMNNSPRFYTHEAGEDGYSEWVYPQKNYLFKCCDCGLVHEMDFGVFLQGEEDETGEFAIMPVEDVRIRPMFRARRQQ